MLKNGGKVYLHNLLDKALFDMKKILMIAAMALTLCACSEPPKGDGFYKGYEMSAYTVLEKKESYEIRSYQSQLTARITMAAGREDAINAGFRHLFDYISGDNITKTKIAMTTPVMQQQEADNWHIRFIVPQEYTVKTAPTPTNKNIHLSVAPADKKAVVGFSGFVDDEKIAFHTKNLQSWIADQKLKTIGMPIIAFYDSPFTLPWNRRNEMMIRVE